MMTFGYMVKLEGGSGGLICCVISKAGYIGFLKASALHRIPLCCWHETANALWSLAIAAVDYATGPV